MTNIIRSHIPASKPNGINLLKIDFNQRIGDNAVTSSIKIAQVFSDLVGKMTRALWKVHGGMLDGWLVVLGLTAL